MADIKQYFPDIAISFIDMSNIRFLPNTGVDQFNVVIFSFLCFCELSREMQTFILEYQCGIYTLKKTRTQCVRVFFSFVVITLQQLLHLLSDAVSVRQTAI